MSRWVQQCFCLVMITLCGTVGLVEWARAQGAQPTVFLYEGWAELDRFPPTRRAYRRYLDFTTGDYHDWYLEYRDAVAAALPEADVHPVLAQEYDAAVAFIWNRMEGVAALRQSAWAPLVEAADTEVAEAPTQAPDPAPAPVEATAAAPATTAESTGTGLAQPSLAMGLNGIADWSTQQPFIDVMKTARHWVGHLPDQWGGWTEEDLAAQGYLDAAGWVMRIPEGVDRIEAFVLTDLPAEAGSLKGRYRVTWEGAGKLDIVGRARVQAREDKTIWFLFEPGEGKVAVRIDQTDPEGIGDYIRNIRIIREDLMPFYEAGMVFNPEFVDRIKDLRALRYRDWMFTNGSPKVGWGDRAQVDDYTYFRRGVPVEHLVALANLVGADPWFCMPHMADESYVRGYAKAVHESLDPRLKPYVEYSNELWNRFFPQATWADEQARARWGNAAGDDGWMQFAGMRAAEVADIWTEVFGNDAGRVINVIGVHTGWPGLEAPQLDAPLWQAEGNAPPAGRFQAYAVSGYFGHLIGSEEEGHKVKAMLDAAAEKARAKGEAEGLRRVALREYVKTHRYEGTIAPLIERLRAEALKELTAELWPYHARVAARHGMTMIMYEGGAHILGHGDWQNDEAMTAYFHRLNYSPEMGDIYAELLREWQAVGGQLFNAFVDIGKPSQYGSWGHLRHLGDRTARWDALMAYNESVAGVWEDRAPDAFLHGVVRRGGDGADRLEGTTEEDVMLGFGGDDVLVAGGRGDFLHGGAGRDIAVLPGVYRDYGFDTDGAVLRAWHRDGVVHLRDIEVLRFDDLELATDVLQ